MECRGRLWEGLQGRKRPRGVRNQEGHAERTDFFSHCHPMIAHTRGGNDHAHDAVILGKGGSLGGGRTYREGTEQKQNLGDLESCKDKQH